MDTNMNEKIASIKNMFSIKNFITDLPRMLNNAFAIVSDVILKFYDADKNKLEATFVEADNITASTIITQNITFTGSNGSRFKYDDIATKLANLEEKINSIIPITQEEFETYLRDSSTFVVINTNTNNN